MPLDIVFENEINQPKAHYMKAVVYDCDQDVITISQTSPALGQRFINRRIIITFLVTIENRILRFGIAGLLKRIVDNYTMSSGNAVEALLIHLLAEPEPTDFRMYFRVKPPSDANLSLFLKEQKVSLLDISIGGAKFTCPRNHLLKPGERIKLKLIIREESFDVDADIRNIQQPYTGITSRNLQYVSVQFRHDNSKMETLLGRAIIDIERNLLSKGAI